MAYQMMLYQIIYINMSLNSAEEKLKAAKDIQKNMHIMELSIKNEVDYLRVEASEKSSFIPCGCMRSTLEVSPSFNRAFKTFSRDEKIDYYYKIVQILKKCIDGEYEDPQKQDEPTRQMTLYFYNEEEGQWQTRRIQMNMTTKSFSFKHGEQSIDLHYYLLRKSKKKDKESLALQCTQNLRKPKTIRLSNYKISYQELKQLLEKLILSAVKESFIRRLSEMGQLPPRKKTDKMIKLSSREHLEAPNVLPKKQLTINVEVTSSNNKEARSSILSPPPHFPINDLQYEKTKVKLINSLTNYANLREVSTNVWVDLKENRVRKIFYINQEDYQIPLEWFSDNLMSASSFRSWKKTLKQVKTLSPMLQESKQKLFYEIHEYKEQLSFAYIYKRQRYNTQQNGIYFFDISTSNPIKSQHPQLTTKSKIQYVVWKFERTSNNLIITVEGKINHEGIKLGNLSISLTDQFLGQIDKICNNSNNVTFFQDSNFQINSVFFEDLYMNNLVHENDDESFYSICVNNEEEKSNKVAIPTKIIKMKSKGREPESPTMKSIKSMKSMGSLTSPFANNLLKWKHPIRPYAKSSNPQYRFPKVSGVNPFWQGQFKFNKKGEMISINEEKIKAGKGIILDLAKTMGRNVLSGKNILNVSMPVTIFSKESNLSLLCKSFCYGPKLLQKAAQQSTPEERFKYVVAFALGCTNAYIQMDKPFNPILGQTFQCFVDGSLIYGQQVSHHPPISYILLKGRGYSAYGGFQAKVNLGINSAKGSNEGITHVSFSDNDISKDVIKFSVPPGQVGGILWGDRTIKCVETTQYLDMKNRLFLELQFAKHKGQTEFSKYENGVEGKLVELKQNVDLSTFPHLKVSAKDIMRQVGIFSGKWTQFILYQDEQVFNYCQEYPHIPEEYPCPLESHAFKRKDLLLRIQQNMTQAQTAKEQLENLQRNDRKLRKQYADG